LAAARIKMNPFLLIIAFSFVLYSVLWLTIYRLRTTKKSTPPSLLQTPIETTTPEQRARGESSFILAKEQVYGISRGGYFVLVLIGYAVVAAACAIVFFAFFRSPTT
jgi:hypothetical protein